ncbi:MAG: HipA family kinase [Terriglobales bacterium]
MAVQHVRKMRGGAQSHMMRAEDGNFYVVKFQNNPQHLRILANELLVTRLAERVGLPVPAGEVIEVSEWLICHTRDLCFQFDGRSFPCRPGLQFGSRYVVDPFEGQVFDYLPEALIGQVRNLGAFAGVLALDKWTCNANGRQATFWRRGRERKYTATFIDQGFCFNAGAWSFPDSPLRGVYGSNSVYEGIHGWEAFDPWLPRIEVLDENTIGEAAGAIPPEWYDGDWEAMETLMDALLRRRSSVRELITAFRNSSRRPFPRWAA